jgi:predicted DCC family thiol-disulfide oxidoreductase YuxK
MITVFYDGQCGLCRKEINYYKRISPKDIFHWQDITVNCDQLNQLGISLSQGLKQLHVQDQHGQLHIGAKAFMCIWSQLKYWRILATIMRIWPIDALAQILYQIFATRRFKKLKHCQIAHQHDTKD